MKSFKIYIISFLIFLFGIEITFNALKSFTSGVFNYCLIDIEEEKETEKDDDKLDNEKYNASNADYQSISVELNSSINFNRSTFLNLLQPHIEVVTPPPDFC